MLAHMLARLLISSLKNFVFDLVGDAHLKDLTTKVSLGGPGRSLQWTLGA